jgi:hypothetical protein
LPGGGGTIVEVDGLPGVEAIAGLRLTLKVGRHARGTARVASPAVFECVLDPEGWEEVADLTEPFCETDGPQASQRLTRTGDVSLLLAPHGGW